MTTGCDGHPLVVGSTAVAELGVASGASVRSWCTLVAVSTLTTVRTAGVVVLVTGAGLRTNLLG